MAITRDKNYYGPKSAVLNDLHIVLQEAERSGEPLDALMTGLAAVGCDGLAGMYARIEEVRDLPDQEPTSWRRNEAASENAGNVENANGCVQGVVPSMGPVHFIVGEMGDKIAQVAKDIYQDEQDETRILPKEAMVLHSEDNSGWWVEAWVRVYPDDPTLRQVECLACYEVFDRRSYAICLELCAKCAPDSENVPETRCPTCGWDALLREESGPDSSVVITDVRPAAAYVGAKSWREKWACPNCGTHFDFTNSSE